jgi:hypothetical protein
MNLLKKLTLMTLPIITANLFVSCLSKKVKDTNNSNILSLDTTSKGEVPGGSDPTKLCEYLTNNQYFPSNSYSPNTKILFSSSYEIVDNSAGQAYGIVGSDGFFEQQGNTTSQMLVCPGASNISGGKCVWKINDDDGYAQLAFDVVCNKRSRSGGAVHPGYDSQSAKLVSFVAKTAGSSVEGQDAVEVVLKGRNSTARIVFGKGTGLVATLFQESSSPAGTAEVFIDAQGSTSRGDK